MYNFVKLIPLVRIFNLLLEIKLRKYTQHNKEIKRTHENPLPHSLPYRVLHGVSMPQLPHISLYRDFTKHFFIYSK